MEILYFIIPLFIIFFLLRGKRIPSAEAKKLVADGALLVDVRTASEFASGHLDGAKNIPLDQLQSRLDELGDKEKAIILYCRSGARSNAALKTLKGAGFSDAHNLGPMSAW